MAEKKGQYDIPFDEDGNQMDYYYGWKGTLRDNFEFEDTLKLVGYSKGRSSVGFTFERSDGTTVNFFLSDFFAIAHKLVDGRITGRFTFVKKGQNYGCRMIGA